MLYASVDVNIRAEELEENLVVDLLRSVFAEVFIYLLE
jgi:hypothetical protein